MKRLLLFALTLFSPVLFGNAYASVQVTFENVAALHAKAPCKKAKGKCVAQKKKGSRHAPKHPTRVRGKHVPPPPVEELHLSSAQGEMRDLFTECFKRSTAEDPVEAVKDFVFSEQKKREEIPGWKAFLAAIRGSRAHHAQETCLARAYGLQGFRSLAEIKAETGHALVPITSPYIEIVEKEIPEDRRVLRDWARDYVIELASAMHRYLIKKHGETANISPLRVTSLIRSFDDQAVEVEAGRSPADCRYNFLCSTHTSGAALDLGLRDVSVEQKNWLRNRLIADQRLRKIYFIVENSHYHVFVLPPEYLGEE